MSIKKHLETGYRDWHIRDICDAIERNLSLDWKALSKERKKDREQDLKELLLEISLRSLKRRAKDK